MKIHNDIVQLDKEEYQHCLAEVTDRLAGQDDIAGIFQFVSVTHPGISDIDMCIVLRDTADRGVAVAEIEEIIETVPHGTYLFFHMPVVIFESDLPYFHRFRETKTIQRLFGSVAVPQPNSLQKVQILTWNSYFYPFFLRYKNATDTVSARKVLLVLKNMEISITNNDRIGNMNFGDKFSQKNQQIRDNVLESNRIDAPSVQNLFSEGVNILQKQERESAEKPVVRTYISSNTKFRRVFLRSGKLFSLRLLKRRVVGVPARYFNALPAYDQLRKEIEESTETKKFDTLRKRFNFPHLL